MSCTCLLHRGCCPIHGEFWEKEFEGAISYWGNNDFEISEEFEKLMRKYIGDPDATVKIKCKNCIQIERIGQ